MGRDSLTAYEEMLLNKLIPKKEYTIISQDKNSLDTDKGSASGEDILNWLKWQPDLEKRLWVIIFCSDIDDIPEDM